MYNFEEIASLSELKELCFYIKAINECGIDPVSQNHSKIVDYLNQKYNLEISVSKLYHFVQKINILTCSDQFPASDTISKILNEYVSYIENSVLEAEKEVHKCELSLYESKLNTRGSVFASSYELMQDVGVKRTLYMQKNNSLLIWAFVLGLFIVTSVYCVIGIGFPTLLQEFVTKSQEIAIVLVSIIITSIIVYCVLYLINRKQLKSWRIAVEDYYKFEENIKADLKNMNEARAALSEIKSKFSINGIQLTYEMIYNFLYNTDELDIKFFASKNKPQVQNKVTNKSKIAKVAGQTLSRYEQNKRWRESSWAALEKENINKEIVARVDNLALCLKADNVSETEQAKTISELYYEELSVNVRNKKIDSAESRLELCKNYVESVDKILQYGKLYLINPTKDLSSIKQSIVLVKEERESFTESVTQMMNRISKACELQLLPEGQITSFGNIKSEFELGRFQGQEISSIIYRYDLAKIYIRIYEELFGYDLLT